ncbi:MAG TPA: zf-HC2 domain-containing protein, partial [Nocardioides sp.]|nr:zf-HC2 domain-containing protein [Nocardioides sp.]
MAHLGSRVSALLDGRLAPAEEERLWAHVHECHPCRDLVEREGWVKTQLATLSLGSASAPERLKSSLMGGLTCSGLTPPSFPTASPRSR